MAKNKRFVELINELLEMHEQKSAGYAGKDAVDTWSNFKMSEKMGVTPFKGCLVRLSDKFMRVASLARDETNDQCREPITDTLLDLASYALIAICLYEEAHPPEVKSCDDVRQLLPD